MARSVLTDSVSSMTPEQKQTVLQRLYAIVTATLDYLESIHAGSFVLDEEDHIREHYEHQKLVAADDLKHGRLARLQRQLASQLKGLVGRVDLSYESYVKEKPGYDVDLFDGLRKRVDAILARNQIRTAKEDADVGTMLRYLEQTASTHADIEKLKSLLNDRAGSQRRKKGVYEEVEKRTTEDGMEEVTISITTGPKPKQYKEDSVTSPDGLRRLIVIQYDDGVNATTSVLLQFANGASGPIYAAKGLRPAVTAYWENNTTVCIQTRQEYDAMPRYRQVRSFDDKVKIQYVETT